MQTTHIISRTFDDEIGMRAGARNWSYGTFYILSPDATEGERRAAVLPHMQLSFTDSNGGLLRTVTSPPGTVSVAAVLENEGKACFGNTKFSAGDVIIFGDTRHRLFFASGRHRIAIVSFAKTRFRKLAKLYGAYDDHIIEHAAEPLGELLYDVFDACSDNPEYCHDKIFIRSKEERLLESLETLIEQKAPYFPRLTKGEKIALEIRDRVYEHIEPDIAINNFAKEYGVTEQTLQNAFKSLFGMTPHKFLRNLKLNHVRKELLLADPDTTTVVAVANKWGFTHMGHFSGYYTRLFGENPSVTLQRGKD